VISDFGLERDGLRATGCGVWVTSCVFRDATRILPYETILLYLIQVKKPFSQGEGLFEFGIGNAEFGMKGDVG